jgi:hypothetical protein
MAVSDYMCHGFQLTRSDMIQIFSQAAADGTVSAAESHDLQTILSPDPSVPMPGYVRDLGTHALNHFNWEMGQPSITSAYSSGSLLGGEMNRWFRGTAHPYVTKDGVNYQQINGPLFGSSGPQFYDVHQGSLGDCYLMSSLAEVADKNPQAIRDMFIDNGDGSYTVRFFDNGTPHYVSVDTQLPVETVVTGTTETELWPGGPIIYSQTSSSVKFAYAHAGSSTTSGDGPLWVALAEKAYVEICSEGWLQRGGVNDNMPSYGAIEDGEGSVAVPQITGKADQGLTLGSLSSSKLENASTYDYVTLDSWYNWAQGVHTDSNNIVNNHCYAMITYVSASNKFEVFNPWGMNNSNDGGILFLTLSQLQQSFDGISDSSVSAAPGPDSVSMVAIPADATVLGALAEPHKPADGKSSDGHDVTSDPGDKDLAKALSARHKAEEDARRGHREHSSGHTGKDEASLLRLHGVDLDRSPFAGDWVALGGVAV